METALEQVLTSCYKAGMISYMDTHPEDFEEAIKLAVTDKQPYSWRAAWLLWSCMEENDPRIQRHINVIVNSLPTKNDEQLRDLLIILQHMELDEKYEGKLFDICVTVWEKIDKKPSVRFNAFRMIVKIARKYPDLSHEIFFLTQEQYLDPLSTTAKKSVYKMIKENHFER